MILVSSLPLHPWTVDISQSIQAVWNELVFSTYCFLTRSWLAQVTITNRLISSQALIIFDLKEKHL